MQGWGAKWLGSGWRRTLGSFIPWLNPIVAVAFLCGAFQLLGKTGLSDGPRICVMAPIGLATGTNSTLKIRGLKLAGAIGVSVRTANGTIKAEIKEKKVVEVPAGLDARDVGDSLVTLDITVPVNLAGSELMISVITPEGTTQAQSVRAVDAEEFLGEIEPNDGFRNAQALLAGKRVFGAINRDKDVDVFAITGHARKFLTADVMAARAGSLLDGVLTLYDSKGRMLASCDDSGGSRDPHLRFQLPTDGTYFLVLQDAGDRGTPWHAYELSAREEP